MLLLVLSFPLNLYADTNLKENEIKVGFYPLKSFNSYDDSGTPVGYNVDYLNQIAQYTGWSYKYIRVNSKNEAIDMLERGEIDLIGGIKKDEVPENKYQFSSYSMGTSYYSILALNKNEELMYEDFKAMDNKKLGYIDVLFDESELQKYTQVKNFSPELVPYKDIQELHKALQAKEIDMILCTFMEKQENEKLILKISPFDFYYIHDKNNIELSDKLNKALLNIEINFPKFQQNLMKQYYPFTDDIPISKLEQEFIDNAPTFRIGYVPNRKPVSYIDEEGNPIGITKDILEMISEISGLKFEYVPIPPITDISYDLLRELNLDFMSSIEFTKINLNSSGISLSTPYLKSQKVIVGRRGETFSSDLPLKIAIASGSKTFPLLLKQTYPNFELIKYSSTEECFEAVKNKSVDILMQSEYCVENFLKMPRYDNLAIIPNVGLAEDLSLTSILYKDNEQKSKMLSDTRLISIINKAINQLDEKTVKRCIIKYTTAESHEITVSDFIYKYQKAIIIIVILILASLSAATYSIILKRRNYRIVQQNEKTLTYITNNINGGVIVLIPDKGFTIVYANDGFFDLIGYNKDDYEYIAKNQYTAYVHSDDIEKLNNLINSKYKNVETQLRIKRIDGKYIHALFRGTFAKSENDENRLFCVVVDITQHNRMMEELQAEKERYQIIMDNSNDIFFDIDIETSKINISKKFEEKFGYSLPNRLHNNITNTPFVLFASDANIWEETINKLMTGCNSQIFQVRLQKKDKAFLWCEIQINLIKNRNNEIMRYVGKITDIDEDVREKKRLKNQSMIDLLTGLYNKSAFFQLTREYLNADGESLENIFMFIDIDNFKSINDRLGHKKGDEVLVEISQKLKSIFRDTDLISRFGGDEFCVFAKNMNYSVANYKAKKICESIAKSYFDDNGEEIKISSSIGIANYPQHGENLEELMENADIALYSAKEKGKNQYVWYHKNLMLTGYQNKDRL